MLRRFEDIEVFVEESFLAAPCIRLNVPARVLPQAFAQDVCEFFSLILSHGL